MESIKLVPESSERRSTFHKRIFFLVIIFIISSLVLVWIYTSFPQLENDEYKYIKLPSNIDEAKDLGRVLSRYKNKFYFEVLSGIFFIYIFLQTFAVPGSIFLSILTGFLFPLHIALWLVCFCSASGASFCYILSELVGKPLVYKYIPRRVDQWKLKVDSHRNNLLFYIIFLRITPFLPNWFINITSPVIDVPLLPFWLGTFIGVAPPSLLAVQAGQTLYELTSSSDTISLNSVMWLALAALLSLVPIVLKTKLRNKFE